jgi:hypothetical protein
LTNEVFDIIFLDNDLGINNGTGSMVSSFLRKNKTNPNNDAYIIIHSWNVVAISQMIKDLPSAKWAPFATEIFFSIKLLK